MRVEVLIPTYRRPDALLLCLDALARQTRPPDRVLVVARDDDDETRAALHRANLAPGVEVEWGAARGQVAQLNRGLALLAGDAVAITDDDTIPDPQWLELIERHLETDPRVGAVGGRDWMREKPDPMDRGGKVVGRVQWFGRIVGAHHLAEGPPRFVDHLKGANMAYRTEAILGLQFDRRLRGSGDEPINDTAFCLAVKRRGWRVLYDPQVSLEHRPAVKWGDLRRREFNPQAHAYKVHNSTLTVLEHLPWWRRPVFAVWLLLVGTRVDPGLLHVALALAGRRPQVWERYRATLAGHREGFRTWRGSRRRPRAVG
jgi:cellulose synthase/poly-beta-1,6-N-acetylglucosamine synthase-like glycosyltransferase